MRTSPHAPGPGGAATALALVLLASSGCSSMDLQARSAPPATPTTGALRVLTLMARFADEPTPELSRAIVDEAIYRKLNHFIRENSYHTASITGRSTDWIPVPGFSDPRTHDWTERQQFIDAALDAAVARGVDFDAYDYVVLVNSGISSVGERFTVPTAGGTRVLTGATIQNGDLYAGGLLKTFVLTHEFGHGLGVGHAGMVDCGQHSMFCAIDDTTNWREYGNGRSIMGTGTGHLTADHKDVLGWFGRAGIRTVTADGRFTLEPYESATGGLKAIRIPRGRFPQYEGRFADINDYLYVEYRQAIGYDADFAPGVYLYVKKDIRTSAALNAQGLEAGAAVTDPVTGATVTVVGTTGAGATIRVSGLRPK